AFTSGASRIVMKSTDTGDVGGVVYFVAYSIPPKNWHLKIAGDKKARPGITTSLYKIEVQTDNLLYE
ncbi:hypothetical protein KKD49_11780, partial [Myxococcota bacterium]|nr:hypothetical protein [Myxococcota bacterium]